MPFISNILICYISIQFESVIYIYIYRAGQIVFEIHNTIVFQILYFIFSGTHKNTFYFVFQKVIQTILYFKSKDLKYFVFNIILCSPLNIKYSI